MLIARLRASTLGRLGGNTLIYGLSGALAGLAGLVTAPLYTHHFNPDQYGSIAIVSSIAALVASLSALGLDSAAARYFYDEDLAVQERTLSTWIPVNLAVTTLAAMLLSALAVPISGVISGDVETAGLIIVAAVALPFGVLKMGAQNFLRFQNRAVSTASFGVMGTIVAVVIPLLFVFGLDLSLLGVFLGQLAAAVIMSVVGVIIVREKLRFRLFNVGLLRKMLKYGLPLVPASIAFWITAASDRLLLGSMEGSGQVGLYALAMGVASASTILVVAFRMAWPPLIFSLLGTRELERTVLAASRWAFWFACVAAVGITVLGRPMVELLSPDSYLDAYKAIPFVAFSSALEFAFVIYSTGASVTKTTTPAAKSVIAGAILNIPLNLLLIPLLGFVGAALATFCSWLAVVGLMYRHSQRLYPFTYAKTDFFLPLLIGFTAALASVLMVARGIPWYATIPVTLPLCYLPLLALVRRRRGLKA